MRPTDERDVGDERLVALLASVKRARNAVEQQQYRGALIADGLDTIAALRAERWLCDPTVALLASQVIREIGRVHREAAAAALEEARPCATEGPRRHIRRAAEELDIQLPPVVGPFVPSYMKPDTVHHMVADHYVGADVLSGEIYLTQCGWVFTAGWVLENLHRLDGAGQQLCGHCQNALGKGK